MRWPAVFRDVLSALTIAALIWASSTVVGVVTKLEVLTVHIDHINNRIDQVENRIDIHSQRIREHERLLPRDFDYDE